MLKTKVRHSPKIRAASKKILAHFPDMRYNGATRQIEAGYRVSLPPCNPMQETYLLHNSVAVPAPIISETPLFIKRRFLGFVSVSCGVG